MVEDTRALCIGVCKDTRVMDLITEDQGKK